MKTIADKIIHYNKHLQFSGKLPLGFSVINPFKENSFTIPAMEAFYNKFYSDSQKRHIILGINPSRHGAAITGVPFTDTKRLADVCGITIAEAHSHEPSSVFIYEMIAAWGGAADFYNHFYINSPFPLAITLKSKTGKYLNANYYDDKALYKAVKPFMVETLKNHIDIGLHTDSAFIMGKKNATFIQQINEEYNFFEKLYVLEHPRYIQQYKSKEKHRYIANYIETLSSIQ